MQDIYDGWGWRTIQAGLERRQGVPWGIQDAMVTEVAQCFVALPYGILWQVNIDW